MYRFPMKIFGNDPLLIPVETEEQFAGTAIMLALNLDSNIAVHCKYYGV
jgi:hypothetical protein